MRASTSLLLLFLVPCVRAQGTFYTWPSPAGQGSAFVAAAGDVDADGVGDFAVTENSLQLPSAPGRLKVYSGAGGGTLLDTDSLISDDFGVRVRALGDIDSDGRGDLVLSGAFALRAVSGANGLPLWDLALPAAARALAELDDLDQDGLPDLAVGLAGSVVFVSSASGVVLLQPVAPSGTSPVFGRSVARLGDMDGDGVADVAVGNSTSVAGTGTIAVYSGATGVQMSTLPPQSHAIPDPSNSFAWSMAAVGDVDGDGTPDLAVSSPYECVGPAGYEGCTNGKVRVLSGADGRELLLVNSSGERSFGVTIESVDDLDGDARRDILVASSLHIFGCCLLSPAEVVAISSASGLVLQKGVAQTSKGLAVVPDVDGDGLEDYLASTSLGFPAHASLHLSKHPEVQSTYACSTKANSEGCHPSLSFSGVPSLSIGPDLAFEASKVIGGSMGMFLWSPRTDNLPFGGATLCLGSPFERGPVVPTGGAGGGCQGSFGHSFSKAYLVAAGYRAGEELFVQAWFRDPGFAPPQNIGLTSSMVATIWP